MTTQHIGGYQIEFIYSDSSQVLLYTTPQVTLTIKCAVQTLILTHDIPDVYIIGTSIDFTATVQ